MGLIGDVYITLEGGPGVAKEARLAWQNGAAAPRNKERGMTEDHGLAAALALRDRVACVEYVIIFTYIQHV